MRTAARCAVVIFVFAGGYWIGWEASVRRALSSFEKYVPKQDYAMTEGAWAAMKGLPKDSCPFAHGDEQWNCWMAGWCYFNKNREARMRIDWRDKTIDGKRACFTDCIILDGSRHMTSEDRICMVDTDAGTYEQFVTTPAGEWVKEPNGKFRTRTRRAQSGRLTVIWVGEPPERISA
jgi:ribosome modulation factor